MALETLLDNLPDYAKDMKLNFLSLVSSHEGLTEPQFLGTVLASAIASRNLEFLAAVRVQLVPQLTPEILHAVQVGATIMAMNNVYYRFLDLAGDSYGTMRAGLRMNAMKTIPADIYTDFEYFSLAVSIVNGCGLCVKAHEKYLLNAGGTVATVQLVAKIASVVHAIAVILETK